MTNWIDRTLRIAELVAFGIILYFIIGKSIKDSNQMAKIAADQKAIKSQQKALDSTVNANTVLHDSLMRIYNHRIDSTNLKLHSTLSTTSHQVDVLADYVHGALASRPNLPPPVNP